MKDVVFEFLAQKLLGLPNSHQFRQLGPHSLIFESETDSIVVFVNQDSVILLHDGPNVVASVEMIPKLSVDRATEEGELDQRFLQPILHRF